MSAQDSDPWLSVTNGKLLLHYYTLYFLFYEATLVTTFLIGIFKFSGLMLNQADATQWHHF